MKEKNKREKVVAEITPFHLMQLAKEFGRSLTHNEALAFLNEGSQAYEMWKHMMQAAETYMKSTIQARQHRAPQTRQLSAA
jgi:hypothetical protein